jgi:hypothetical protein
MAMVTAAREEFNLAVQFHEAWKPAAFDPGLHRRMSHCHAGKTFLVVRTALRRELLLALMRLWDRDSEAIKMEFIRSVIGDRGTIALLARQRADRMGLPSEVETITNDLSSHAKRAKKLIDKYSKGGCRMSVFERLWKLRNERLAHRQTALAAHMQPDVIVSEVEEFYVDMSKLIKLLASLVFGLAYDPIDLSEVCQFDAKYFWEGVSGERTVGHPSYRL